MKRNIIIFLIFIIVLMIVLFILHLNDMKKNYVKVVNKTKPVIYAPTMGIIPDKIS